MHPHHIQTSSKLSETLPKYWIKDPCETVSHSPLKVNFKWLFVVKNFLNCQQSMPGNSTLFTKTLLHFPFALWHQWDKYLWTLWDKALNIFKKCTPRRDTAEEKDCLSGDPVTLCCHTGKKWYMLSPLQSVQFSSVAQSCPTLCDPMNCSMPGLHKYVIFKCLLVHIKICFSVNVKCLLLVYMPPIWVSILITIKYLQSYEGT